MYVAAIDIGSNAIRLAIADTKLSPYHVSYRSREPVRLGSSVFSEGQINDNIYQSLRNALLQFKNQLENHNVSHFRAVATSAMREATNNQEVVTKLKQETGIEIEIISGDEEARLVNLAISQKIDLNQGQHLLIDIGGGSIELIAIDRGQVLKKQSFVLGMVRVLELDKTNKQNLKDWLPPFIQKELRDFFADLPALKTAVGTGGNMDRFVKLKPHVSQEPGEFLTRKDMKKLYTSLEEVDYKQRIAKFCLKPDRADVIIPAAIATLEILKMAGAQTIDLPQVGLKDGLLYELS